MTKSSLSSLKRGSPPRRAIEGSLIPYVPLWCKSNSSFLEGASHPEELVEEAYRLGLSSLAITDRDGVYGIVRAHLKALELGMHLIIGSQITIAEGATIILLVENHEGYRNLCQLVTKGRLRSKKGTSSVPWSEVAEHQRGLLALFTSPTDEVPLDLLKEAFGTRLFALATRHCLDVDVPFEKRLRERAAGFGIPIVAGMEVLYHHQERRDLQDVLTAIRYETTVRTAGRLLKPNAEYGLRTPASFRDLYADDPISVDRTLTTVERCNFSLKEIRYRYPAERLPDGSTTSQRLSHLTFEGARWRYGGEVPEDMKRQLRRELDLIEELDYGGYFLTMYEIVRYCRENEILCQGRGSAANSSVCYCLGITAVDPVRMGFLFERFISKTRADPPDIDLDIMHQRREEVIQFVYEKYGRNHAAMVANVVRYRARSGMRDVGKALGLPETSLARLSGLLPHHCHGPTSESFKSASLDPETPAHQHLLRLTNTIQGFPRHLSIHPGGFLLGHEPVHHLVPIENATMKNRTVIQWDKDDIEALGLFKVDLLGLGALTQLDLCFRLLQEHRGVELSMATIPPNDQDTFDMICRSETVGVFQIESRAQMAMLTRLKPRTYYDLVIEVSIVRPGPITGGMVHPYLRRRNGEEPVAYLHEILKPVLEKTLGVPLFQEQVMRIAVVAADYTPEEADQLRRDMSAWRRTGRIERHRKRLTTRMQAKGIAAKFSEHIFQQIKGFGEYGFPESHAASFALISYAAAYLLRHYPAEFICGLLNAQPMGFYSSATIIDDGKRRGVVFLPIDVCFSSWDCTLFPASSGKWVPAARQTDEESPFFIRMGLRYVKGLSENDWVGIESARYRAPFVSMEDFAKRTALNEKALATLAEAGAFDRLEQTRRTSLWKARGLRKKDTKGFVTFPEKEVSFDELGDFERIAWDYDASSHSTYGHPLAPLREILNRQGFSDAKTLSQIRNGSRAHYAGLVICRQRPSTASGVTFMTLEDETGFVNLVVWPKKFEEYATLVKATTFLGATGKIQAESGVVHLVVDELWRPQLSLEPRGVKSRDFH